MSDTYHDLPGDLIRYENGELSALQTLELFGHLIRTGLAWSLQGSYGRAAQTLLDNGMLTSDGNLTDAAIEYTQTFPESDD